MINNKENIYLIILTSFLLAIIFYTVTWYGFNVPKYNYQAGQIAQEAIKAPFAFNVLKPEAIIENEVSKTLQSYPTIYKISEDIKFNTYKQLDDLFVTINDSYENYDSTYTYNKFTEIGLAFDYPTINYLNDSNTREYIYNYLSNQLSEIMKTPLVNDSEKNNFFRLSKDFEISETLNSKKLSISEAKKLITQRLKDPIIKLIVTTILDKILSPNLEIDLEASIIEKENIRKSIDPVISKIEKNEYIILKNQVLSEQDILKLKSLVNVLKEKKDQKNYIELAISALGQFLYNIIILILFYFLTQIFFKQNFTNKKRMILTLASFILSVIITVLIYYIFGIKNILLIPLPMFVLIIAMIFNPSYGIIYSLFIMIITGQYLNWNMLPLINLLICSIVSLLVLRKVKQINYLLLFIYIFSSLSLASFITTLYRNENFSLLTVNLFYSLITSTVSIIGALLITPAIEKKFEFATKQSLLELLNFNNPLLKRLSKEAPGTYYHSLIVGNLAEACAEAINADPLISRVASYYHDIGKLDNPKYFIENNPDSTFLHNELKPEESASIIREHVENGISLGKKHKLPTQIIDIIKEHHGDSVIRYFLHKAKESNLPFNEKDFSYYGPKPQTKESAVVMIADIVESTTKSLKSPNNELIEKIINDSINYLIAENQLINAPITIKELHIIKLTMLPILNSIHRKRIEYPDNKNE